MWQDNIRTCAACPRVDRTRKGPGDYWLCGESGREFIEHCRDWSCPLNLHCAKSAGLGDTVARTLAVTGIALLAKLAIEKATGKPCGCGGRQDALNAAAPYRPT